MSTWNRPDQAISTDEGTWLERIVESFEDCWEGGIRPEIGGYLPTDLPRRRAALVELVHVDLERRLKAGEAARVEDYLRRFPELAGDRRVILDLIAAEHQLRSRREPDLTRDEYLRRFPLHREPLLAVLTLAPTAGDWAPRSRPAATDDPACAPGRSTQETPATTQLPAEDASRGVVPALTTVDSADSSPSLEVVSGAPKIAGYEILGELGRGGMGVVYLARQLQLKRPVALKMILPGAKPRSATLERFRIEAQAVARLQHPHIVQIYEVGQHDGRPFLCLEYAPGGSLAQKLAGTPQQPADAARMVQTLARAVHAAHQRGIVHRDLKPANVLLMADGTPKITDFGLAKQLDIEEGISLSGEVKGTPSYMAPEQAAGKTKTVGPLADVYALGAILYDMLTGRPPFKAATAVATVAQVLEQEPVPPGRLHPKLPRDLETICLKCLEKDPYRRYASAEALAEDLRRFLAHEPIAARPVGPWTRALKWARRRPAAAALVAVLLGTAVGLVAGVLLYQDQRARIAEQELQRERAEQRHLMEQRVAIQDLVVKGQGALARGDLQEAKLHFTAALDQIGSDPKRADLGAQVAPLLAEVDRRLADEAQRLLAEEARRESRTWFDEFKLRRNDALFRQTLFTGGDPAEDLEATKAAARDALALFGLAIDSEAPPAVDTAHFDATETAQIRTGCYEMLLTLAEAVAQARPGQPPDRLRNQAEQAVRILDRAEKLGFATRVYHQRRARYLAQLGDEAGARREHERAEALRPTLAIDFYLLGDEKSRSNDLKPAIRDFYEALRLQPDHFWAQYGLATCYLRLQQWDAAKTSLTTCIGQRPDFAWIYPLRALALSELGEDDAAEADFRTAEELQPDESTRYALLVGRGVVRLRQEKYDEAVALLQAAVALRPDSYQAHVNLAQAYQKQHQLDAALEHLDHAIRHMPSLASLYRERAGVHLCRDDAAAALRDLDRAIQLEPLGRKAPDDHAERGRILQKDGRLREAVQAYDAALALRPDLASVHRRKAEALTQLADAEPAQARGLQQQIIRALDAYLETGTPQAEIFRARGQARSKLGDYAGALDDYSRALSIEPDAATHAARGWTYQLAFDASALALRDFEAAIRLDAQNGDAYHGRGFARVRLGHDVRDAVADAEQAIRLGPEAPRTLYNAARTYAQAVGRFDARTVPRSLPPARRGQYQDRAVQLLRQAVARVPAAQRGPFWKTIEPDVALDPIRRSSGFLQLIVENSEAAN